MIAIENVRLFDEVQARTRDLTEALQQQTATADVLKVISRSAFDLKPCSHVLVQAALELCHATLGDASSCATATISGSTTQFGLAERFGAIHAQTPSGRPVPLHSRPDARSRRGQSRIIPDVLGRSRLRSSRKARI